ncbi:MAG: MATE family efflux transporter, partial [Clostridia bacterium]|nr:MATE family efflux transporter [Clostridia bacterium]
GVAGLRGIGSSFLPMSVSILGIFGIRMAMIISCGPYTSFDSLKNLYISYPVAWTVTGVILFIVFAVLFSKKKKALQKI